MVKIDCRELRLENFETFKACGWNSCEKGFFKSAPDYKYDLWIPNPASPLNIFSISETNLCFAKLIEPHFNPNGNIFENFISKKKGITVEIVIGNECGKDAV